MLYRYRYMLSCGPMIHDTQHNTRKLKVSQTLALTLITDNSDVIVMVIHVHNNTENRKVMPVSLQTYSVCRCDTVTCDTLQTLHHTCCPHQFLYSFFLVHLTLTPVIKAWVTDTCIVLYIFCVAPIMKLIHRAQCIV